METTKLRDKILFMANEDYSGLWEVYEEAKDLYSEFAQKDLIEFGKGAILDLIERGWIQLYWCKELLTNDRVTPMEPDEASQVLSENKYWNQPEKDSISIRFLATSEGEKAFEKKFLK